MATLLRTVVRARGILAVPRKSGQLVQQSCLISTSKKNKDGISISVGDTASKEEELKAYEKHFGNQDPNAEKNWVSWEFDTVDKDYDQFSFNMTMFTGITLMVFLVFFFSYAPDHGLKSWALREAYLELERREKMGLPLIDPNMVDPENVTLPSEEELGDMKIRL